MPASHAPFEASPPEELGSGGDRRQFCGLAIEALSVRNFRNLARVDLELGAGFNVLSGDNAQGKTSVLEALYVLATSRSFRTAKLAEVVGFSAQTTSVRACIRENGEVRDQSVGVQAGRRAARIDGKRPESLAAYAVRTPVIIFHPGALTLSAGAGSTRRKLLDRVGLYASPGSFADREGYAHAAQARRRVLGLRGTFASELDDWEELMVRHGLGLSQVREDAVRRLAPGAVAAFARIGLPDTTLQLRYVRSAPYDAGQFRAALAASRVKDRARGWASVGPHRDDLALELEGRLVRGLASQGQHRVIVLALELAERDAIASVRGVSPVLLLDDVSSELDQARTQALFVELRERGGQILVTTTRPELVDASQVFGRGHRRDFTVVAGRILPR